MKKILILSSFLLICTSTVFSQNMERVKRNIDTLAAPGMHGRGYAKGGDKIAATFIQDRYKEFNLQPLKKSDSLNPYYQYFNFDVNIFESANLSLDQKKLEFGKDYLIHPASGPGKGCAKTFFLDTLIFTSEAYHKKFLKKSLAGKAFIFSSAYTKKVFSLPKSILAKIFEASCLIEIVETKLTFSISSFQYPIPYYQLKKESCHVKIIRKINFESIAKVEKYKSQNVIGCIKGKSKPDSFIVVSAHYDHLGRVGKAYFPGANDNSSGISMMLELANFYSQKENQPEYSIVFMAFSAEEAGLIGSHFYVNNPLFPLSKIKFLINLDLLGTGDDGVMVVNATKFPQQFKILSMVNEDGKLLPAVKQRGPAANSDHYYFTEKGVPAFFIYTLGGIAAYHDIYDKAETLPLTKFKEVFSLLTGFIDKF